MAELKAGSPLSLLPRDDILDRWMLFYSLLFVKSTSVVPTTQETYVFS